VNDRLRASQTMISNSGEAMNEEQHGHDQRVGAHIIVGPSKPSNPAVATFSSHHVSCPNQWP
jgi:hypothetical protein